MTITLSTASLRQAIAAPAKASASKGLRPILSHLMLRCSEGELQIVGTDLEIMSIASIPHLSDDVWETTVPAKLFEAVVSGFSAPEVTLAVDPGTMTISAGQSRFTIPTLDAAEYPPVPRVTGDGAEDYPYVEIPAGRLADCLRIGGLSADLTGTTQGGIGIDFAAAGITVTSTDHKRLSRVAVSDPAIKIPDDMQRQIIISPRSLPEILRQCSGDEVGIGIYRNQLIVNGPTGTTLARLLDVKIPDASRVIPKERKTRMTVDRKTLAAAIKQCRPVCDAAGGMAHLDLGDACLTIRADAADVADARVSMAAALDGTPNVVCVNYRFIAEWLAAVESDEIAIEMTKPTLPIVLKADGVDGVYVVMPMTG